MKLTDLVFKVIRNKSSTSRGIRVVVLYFFHFSVLITTCNGANINVYIGLYKIEIGIGFYFTSQY